MKAPALHWEPIRDKWGIGVEAYYLRGSGRRLGWVSLSAGPPMSSEVYWTAGHFRDDGQTKWIGDYETKDAAMQAVKAIAVPDDDQDSEDRAEQDDG